MNQQQQIHPAAAACQFMQRADMKGNEVEIFAQTYNWLQAILEGELVVLEASKLGTMEEQIQQYEKELGAVNQRDHDPEAPMEVTPENEPVGEDIPILEVEELQGIPVANADDEIMHEAIHP